MKNPEAVQLIMRYYETWAGINAAYERFAARLGVTANLLYLLDLLCCVEQPLTQSEIGTRLGLPKQTVASMFSGLERKGYAVREVSSADHRRRYVRLTEAGRACAQPLSDKICAFERAAFGRMQDAEQLALVETSEKLQRALHEVLDEECRACRETSQEQHSRVSAHKIKIAQRF